MTLSTPAPDGSIHTGVGFYGLYADQGGSTNVHLSDFAIEGDIRERIDTDQVNGIGGSLSNSSITGLGHPAHQGRHMAGRLDDELAHHSPANTIVDQLADGINFLYTGATDLDRSRTTSSAIRETTAPPCGRETTADANDTFDHVTIRDASDRELHRPPAGALTTPFPRTT